MKTSINMTLQQVAQGRLSVKAAERILKKLAEKNLGFARVDLARARRVGLPEVIYCPGKNAAQIIAIMRTLAEAGQNILATRATPEQFTAVRQAHPQAQYHELARAITLSSGRRPLRRIGRVSIVCAGTSDIPVAEEAALAAQYLEAKVERIFDVGVAGLHRLLKHIKTLKSSRAIVVVAGMEGALPSVIGGLVDRPLIAVPSSIGYGAALQGIAALLAMLNSCVPGISVVNIDNGFGAGVAAGVINRQGGRS